MNYGSPATVATPQLGFATWFEVCWRRLIGKEALAGQCPKVFLELIETPSREHYVVG